MSLTQTGTKDGGQCRCGCGRVTAIAEYTRADRAYVKGEHQPFCVGHRPRLKSLYPATSRDGEKVGVHVLVAERAIGRRLPKGAVVHHVDGNRENNLPANLVICQDMPYHEFLHARLRIKRAGGNPNSDALCGGCGQTKPREAFSLRARNRSTGRQGMCKDCASNCRIPRPEELDLDDVIDPEWQ